MARERRRKLERASSKGTGESDDVDEKDDYSDYPLPTAAEGGDAVAKGMSLFDLKVPGLMTAEEIEETLDLATMPIRVGGRMAEAQDLVSWESSDLRNPKSIQGIIGEMVACMGPEVAWQIVVQLG